jgi:hypothetical protein
MPRTKCQWEDEPEQDERDREGIAWVGEVFRKLMVRAMSLELLAVIKFIVK